jgi:hypothetical protein
LLCIFHLINIAKDNRTTLMITPQNYYSKQLNICIQIIDLLHQSYKNGLITEEIYFLRLQQLSKNGQEIRQELKQAS